MYLGIMGYRPSLWLIIHNSRVRFFLMEADDAVMHAQLISLLKTGRKGKNRLRFRSDLAIAATATWTWITDVSG